ncbi:MAG: DUF4230 domain-containing protein [Lachnospiraceae bacterium]|nr:DUF4230 domain-containing protein [Lachnospiraceae bacterium]
MNGIDEHELALLEKQKRKILNLVKLFLVLLVIILVAIFLYVMLRQKNEITGLKEEVERLSDPVAIYEEATKEVDIHVINAAIQDIGELATVEYLYTDAGKFEDVAELFGKNIPFTKKTFIAKWDGAIKAGVDISKVNVETNNNTKEIIVHIPKAEILSHEIDVESIETLDEKNGLFNKLKVEDVREFDAISKEAMEQRAIENGLLDKAFSNTKDIIYKIVDTDIVEELEYTITFKEIE